MRATTSTIDAATTTVTGRPASPQTIVAAMKTMRATSSGSRTRRDQSPRNTFCQVRPELSARVRPEFGHVNLRFVRTVEQYWSSSVGVTAPPP